MALEKYEMDGATYYFNPKNGSWLNSSYTRVGLEEKYKLNKLRVQNIDFDNIDTEELLSIAQSMKDNNDTLNSARIFNELLNRCEDAGVVRNILPRYTSILRMNKQPKEAINMFEKYYDIYGKSIYSPALFTSVAAAYCDTGDYNEARNKANVANAMSGGKASEELISVYARIKRMEV